MARFKEVNKLLGENVIHNINLVSRKLEERPKDWNYQRQCKIFCDNLRANNYEVSVNGNYVNATKDNETVTFYFSAHSPQNKNYCITAVLENNVDYFAFYNNKTDSVYLVGYGIVREYCKHLKNAYIFYKRDDKAKLFIPDSWAQSQKINTMLLY